MKKWNRTYLFILIISVLCICIGCALKEVSSDNALYNDLQITQEIFTEDALTNEKTDDFAFHIYYIDVGQADAALIAFNGHFMLIDAGNNSDETFIVNYLKEHGVTSIDYLIGTHPHADHIGGMDAVINEFDIGAIYMPRIMHDTQTFEDVLTAIENKNLTVKTPIAGEEFIFHGIPIQILSPIHTYGDLNNNSIVLKINYDKRSFLFTGDMESEAEMDVQNAGYDLTADVIKIAHHGSDTSSSLSFLQAVSPKLAIISVGANNNYSHPDSTVLSRLEDLGIFTYRTDEAGTVILLV